MLLYHKAKSGKASFYASVDNGEFVGFAYVIQSDKMVYVFFLAVEEDKRGMGYGSKILAKIKEMYPDKTVTLEIEDTAKKDADNYDERIKRLEFYKRNGFFQLDIRVVEAGVGFELLGTKPVALKKDFLTLMKNYLGLVLFKYVYKNNKGL